MYIYLTTVCMDKLFYSCSLELEMRYFDLTSNSISRNLFEADNPGHCTGRDLVHLMLVLTVPLGGIPPNGGHFVARTFRRRKCPFSTY